MCILSGRSTLMYSMISRVSGVVMLMYVAEKRGEESGFFGLAEPDYVRPAPEWWDCFALAFKFRGEVGFGDDGAAGGDEGVVVETSDRRLDSLD